MYPVVANLPKLATVARTGRRPGSNVTRQEILAAARHSFATRGYDATSVRGVARVAGVDPALVHHFFGTKHALFAAAMDLPVDPADMVRGLLEPGVDGVGERLVRTLLAIWDSPEGAPFLGLMRNAVTQDDAARMLREFLATSVLRELAEAVGADEPELRASLAASQIMGLGMARKLIGLEPLASADRERLVRAVAPTIDRYLTGDLD
jgi:AcrR family transcriptional regulator